MPSTVFATICSRLWRRGPKMFSAAVRGCGNGRACMVQKDGVRKAQQGSQAEFSEAEKVLWLARIQALARK